MTVLAQVGGVVGCAGLAVLLCAPWPLARLGGLAAAAFGVAAMGVYLLGDVAVPLLVAGAVGAVVLGVAGAWVLLKWPYVLGFAALACVPVRIPVDVGAEEANLLVPLYGVIGALGLSLAWRIVRGDGRSRELGRLAPALAAFVGWSGLTILWADDLEKASILLASFVIPFGVLAIGFARLPWRGGLLVWLWAALAATALAYALVGAYQWATRDVFWNPSVSVFNAYAPFFRVNSVFWDPSVYGRYLVVAILGALAGVVLGGVRGGKLVGLYLVIVATWFGLLISFSQSSFAALAAGIVIATAVAWGRQVVLALVVLAALAVVVTFAVPQVRNEIVDRSRTELNKVTGGRSNLVGQGVRIFADNPVVGVGVGGFNREYARRLDIPGKDPKRTTSHTTPVTVAAEQGVVGLALYLWLVATMIRTTLFGLGRGFTSRVSLAVGIALAAIGVHSLFYGAFFEDPMTWALAGLVGLAGRVPRKPSPRVAAPAADYAQAAVEAPVAPQPEAAP